MSRQTLVYRPNDPSANNNGMVPKHLAAPLNVSDAGPMVMGDIEPYRAVAADVDGKRHVIGGRRQHREFLARNGYTEVGNERMMPRREELSRDDRFADIRRAMASTWKNSNR